MLGLKMLILMAMSVALTYSNVVYDAETIPEPCTKNRVIEGDYIPRGRIINIGNLPVYEAPGNLDRRRLLIAVYDIFGFATNNMKQITDQMSLQYGGFRAVLPDFFAAIIGTSMTYLMSEIFIPNYRTQNAEQIPYFSPVEFSALELSSGIELSSYFKAGGMVHPAFITNEQGQYVRMPMYVMPTGDQMDMLPFYQALRIKFGDNSGHRRFDDMWHGFAAARGNFSDPFTQMHVNEVIRTLGAFFERNLPL